MDRLRAYLETLTVSQGRRAGEPLKVLPWQARFLRGAFGDDNGTAALSVGRGNGKTAVLAGVACAALDGPLVVPRGEVVIVAASYMQGRAAFDHVRAFMGDKLKDRRRWRVWDTAQQARIECLKTGASVRCLGSDPRRAHGLAPVLVLADEPAQWPDSTGERMVAALQTAAGKQPHSRFVALGTRPAVPDHWFSKMLTGGADYSQCHAALPDDPPFRRRTWRKANPSLDHMPDLAAAIAREAMTARRDPAILAQFRALRLNMGTADIEVAVLVDASLWSSIEGAAAREGPCTWGLDLGTSAAQSAIAAYWPATGRLEVMAAFPGEPTLAERGLRDGVGGLYVECAGRGELIQTGGKAVALVPLFVAALARFGPPSVVAGDRWRLSEAIDSLMAARVPSCPFEARGQGFRDGAEDVRTFRRACAEGKVTPSPSLLLRSAMAEARVVMDATGNAKLSKQTHGGRRLRARDDAAAAAIQAVSIGVRLDVKPRRAVRSMIL